MFASRRIACGAALLVAAALGVARASTGASPTVRYVVQPGDTLWDIAARRYDGDAAGGAWRIREASGLDGGELVPGQVLVLP